MTTPFLTPPEPPAAERTPDLAGAAGMAWRLDVEKGREIAGPNPDDSTLGVWIVYAPNSHPLWPYVLISMIHLREVEGQTEAPVFYLPGATHEIAVLALEPDQDLVPVIDGKSWALKTLSPANFVGQWIATSDEKAVERLRETVRAVVEGYLNPDSDGISQWINRFGDHAIKLAYRQPKGRA